jgi:hypothetical protein
MAQQGQNSGSRQAVSVDAETGELMDGVFVYVPKKVRNGDFYMAFQAASSQIARDKDFTGATYRVLHAMLGQIDFENYIVVNQSLIAEQLGMKRPNVAREIRKLVNKGVLRKGPKSGCQVTYQLNPHFAWRGKSGKVRDAQAQSGPLRVIEGGQSDAKDKRQADIEDWLNKPK